METKGIELKGDSGKRSYADVMQYFYEGYNKNKEYAEAVNRDIVDRTKAIEKRVEENTATPSELLTLGYSKSEPKKKVREGDE